MTTTESEPRIDLQDFANRQEPKDHTLLPSTDHTENVHRIGSNGPEDAQITKTPTIADVNLAEPQHATEAPQNADPASTHGRATQPKLRKISWRPALTPPEQSLSWRPFVLSSDFLLTASAACVATIAGICGLLYGPGPDRQAALTNGNAHFLSMYAPALIAAIHTFVFRAIVFEWLRMLPYFRMADQKGQISTGATAIQSVVGCLFPFPFVYYKGDWLLKIFINIFLFATTILTAVKTVLIDSQRTDKGWTLTVNAVPAYYLMTAYTLMTTFYVSLYLRYRNTSTGLRWDPAAPLDQAALIMHTDAMSQIRGIPLGHKRAYMCLGATTRWRIGYWHRVCHYSDHTKVEELVHGIGMIESQALRHVLEPACTCKKSTRCDFGARLLPANANPWFLLTYLVIVLLSLAAVVTGAVLGAVLGAVQDGWTIQASWVIESNDIPQTFATYAGSTVDKDDSLIANLFFRTLPTVIMEWLSFTVMSGLSLRMRCSQVWSDLAAGPCTSSKSTTLNYMTTSAFLVPILATDNKHYRLALVATTGILATFGPVFVAGLVTFERVADDTLKLTYSKFAFFVVTFYLASYAASIILARPRSTEVFLRPMHTIADSLRPFCYADRLRSDLDISRAMFAKSQDKFHAELLLAERLYQLTWDQRQCGHDHLAIDIVGCEGDTDFSHVRTTKQLNKERSKHRGSRKYGRSQWIDDSAAGVGVPAEQENVAE